MARMSSQQLTMCLWGLGVSGASPHKAFVLLWFLTSMGLMQQATTQVRWLGLLSVGELLASLLQSGLKCQVCRLLVPHCVSAQRCKAEPCVECFQEFGV
jgi:hypothetical protein